MGAPSGLDRAEVTALLDHWTAAGFIDTELADRMRADVAEVGTADRRRAAAVEALTYLASAVVLAGLGLVGVAAWIARSGRTPGRRRR